MGSLIGLKNVIMFSAVLLTIGSVSAQLAFSDFDVPCLSIGSGNWNNASNWDQCSGGFPNIGTDAGIQGGDNIVITGNEETRVLSVSESGTTLFIDCDASLNLFTPGFMTGTSNITNHGTFTSVENFTISGTSTLFNSGTLSNIVEGTGSIEQISTICTQPIGGTVGSMSTTSLLVAGAQANMGLWSLALVGMVGAAAAITYKLKSKKTEQ